MTPNPLSALSHVVIVSLVGVEFKASGTDSAAAWGNGSLGDVFAYASKTFTLKITLQFLGNIKRGNVRSVDATATMVQEFKALSRT